MHLDKQQQAHAACLEELREATEEARPESRRLEKEEGVRAAPPAVSGLNTGRRSQALSLYRRGGAPRQIAAAVSLPPSEAGLLLKAEKLAVEDS